MNNTTSWLPAYSVRSSKRAKQPSLSISRQKGLEVVLPDGWRTDCAEQLLNDKRDWIEKHWQDIEYYNNHKSKSDLPKQLSLRALQQIWTLHRIETCSRFHIMTNAGHELHLVGQDIGFTKQLDRLRQWLVDYANLQLTRMLTVISEQTALGFDSVHIRAQRARWGSCSSDRIIQLNYKLLFLPYDLVRHVLIHELCHTIEMNHSRRFWQLVKKHDANYKQFNDALKHAYQYIPAVFELMKT